MKVGTSSSYVNRLIKNPEKNFQFSPVELQNIHRKLFEGVLHYAGRIRDYNITKNE